MDTLCPNPKTKSNLTYKQNKIHKLNLPTSIFFNIQPMHFSSSSLFIYNTNMFEKQCNHFHHNKLFQSQPKMTIPSEIVFFDLETTVPHKTGQKFFVLEFGAIVVCPRKLVELESYCTLIRPKDLSAVALKSSRCDGITRQGVKDAPFFEDVADKIFQILNGRIWAGHNIRRFDCIRINETFEEIGKPVPMPVGMIDSLGVLTEKFGRRAGNMKMATLATYFGLGQQKHRSLDDVRMNLEVVKHCATVLFLESSLPGVLNGSWPHGSPTVTTRSRSIMDSNFPSVSNRKWETYSTRSRRNIGKFPCGEESSRKTSTSLSYQRAGPYARGSFRKMRESMTNLLCKPQNNPLSSLLKHSHSLLR